jgi:RsiW-degrading membrane proteinase PrsW (M82 family)
MRRIGDGFSAAVAVLWNLFWAIALGILVLWVFFLAMGAVSIGDPLWLTIAMAVLAVLAGLHFTHLRRMMDEPEHMDMARRVHMLREHRGF